MKAAARFCKANGFTWDGVISQESNIRDFITDNASFALLGLHIHWRSSSASSRLSPTTLMARLTTRPNRVIKIFEIKALFTDGNMRNYKVSFLPLKSGKCLPLR